MIWVLVKRIISYQEKSIKGKGEIEMDREKGRDTKEESEREREERYVREGQAEGKREG